MIKLIIFDFDGTIADTKKAYYSSILKNLKEKGFNKNQSEKLVDEGLSLKATLDKLGLGFISKLVLHRKIMQEVKSYLKQVHKCKSVSEIRKIKCRKIIVSNSLDEFMLPIIKHLKLNRYFKEIYGADDFSEKVQFISKYIKRHSINPKEVIYVGDRVADVRLAKDVGCIGAIISGKCAWNSKKEVEKANPDFLIGDFSYLKKIVGYLNRDGM